MNAAVFAVENIPLIKKGDDIARILTQRAQLSEHDIIAISSTVVSKSEGRVISLKNVNPTERAKII
ncbi:MAG TPA: coenzyme F420-0:L-glutamate ligase, partial [Candidatus Methanoperedens sp.]